MQTLYKQTIRTNTENLLKTNKKPPSPSFFSVPTQNTIEIKLCWKEKAQEENLSREIFRKQN